METKIRPLISPTLYKTACGKELRAFDLIGEKVKIINDDKHKDTVWTVKREGLFLGCVDLTTDTELFLDAKIDKLKIEPKSN